MDGFSKKMFRQAMGYFNNIQSIDETCIKELETIINKFKSLNVEKDAKNGVKTK